MAHAPHDSSETRGTELRHRLGAGESVGAWNWCKITLKNVEQEEKLREFVCVCVCVCVWVCVRPDRI